MDGKDIGTSVSSAVVGSSLGFFILSPFTLFMTKVILLDVAVEELNLWGLFWPKERVWAVIFTYFGGSIGLAFGMLYCEIRKKNQEILQAENRFRDYVFEVADGLRNPLQIFMGHLEDFDTSNFDAEQARKFKTLLEANELVDSNIVRLTKLDGGNQEVEGLQHFRDN